jgi:hypothetical protein
MPARSRIIAFAALMAVCAIGVVVVVLGLGGDEAAGGEGARMLTKAESGKRPVLVYRAKSGDVKVAGLGAANASGAEATGVRCDRVTFGAGGQGICLTRGGGFASGYRAEIFDAGMKVRHAVKVEGIPSRARVSRDGRYGSVTLFVTGHSYAAAGAFSTQTTLIDLRRGVAIGSLEDFTTTRDGHQITAVDVNYWGVTFDPRDSDRFYATIATGGHTYLIEGSVSRRTAHTLHENVECPSVSPEGTRIAYKKRVGPASAPWRLYVLDLRTGHETPLAEQRSVDDQVEWLDGANVLYGVAGAIWTAKADGSGAPRRFVGGAGSPAVVRF